MRGLSILRLFLDLGGYFFVLIFGGFDFGFGRGDVCVALCSGFCWS
jgi:hypothetical protein